jgi:hypothetical protein
MNDRVTPNIEYPCLNNRERERGRKKHRKSVSLYSGKRVSAYLVLTGYLLSVI